jgi:hypothetical protein
VSRPLVALAVIAERSTSRGIPAAPNIILDLPGLSSAEWLGSPEFALPRSHSELTAPGMRRSRFSCPRPGIGFHSPTRANVPVSILFAAKWYTSIISLGLNTCSGPGCSVVSNYCTSGRSLCLTALQRGWPCSQAPLAARPSKCIIVITSGRLGRLKRIEMHRHTPCRRCFRVSALFPSLLDNKVAQGAITPPPPVTHGKLTVHVVPCT